MAYSEQMGFLRKDEYFFPSPDGSRYSLATMDTTFRDILFRAGILYRGKGKGPRLHDLRHTFCVHSLQKLTAHGEDPYAVLPLLMTYMGHRTVQATSQYIHLSAESFPAILKQSEALFGNLIPLEDTQAIATSFRIFSQPTIPERNCIPVPNIPTQHYSRFTSSQSKKRITKSASISTKQILSIFLFISFINNKSRQNVSLYDFMVLELRFLVPAKCFVR